MAEEIIKRIKHRQTGDVYLLAGSNSGGGGSTTSAPLPITISGAYGSYILTFACDVAKVPFSAEMLEDGTIAFEGAEMAEDGTIVLQGGELAEDGTLLLS